MENVHQVAKQLHEATTKVPAKLRNYFTPEEWAKLDSRGVAYWKRFARYRDPDEIATFFSRGGSPGDFKRLGTGTPSADTLRARGQKVKAKRKANRADQAAYRKRTRTAATKSDFTIRKWMGDDRYSWAVFWKQDLKGIPRGPVTSHRVRPIVDGLGRDEALAYKRQFEKSPPKR